MFKNFFNKHVSIITANEEVLDVMSDTLENGMQLSVGQLGQYTEEDYTLIGKRKFNLVGLITDETFAKLGQLIVQMEKYNANDLKFDTFEKFLDILNIYEHQINPKNLTSNLIYSNGYKLSVNTLTDLTDAFDYQDYEELLSKAEFFINYKVREINTVLNYLSNEQVIELIQKGLFYFSPYKYLLINFESDEVGGVYEVKGNKTYLIGVNYSKEVYVGFTNADGKTLLKSSYAELSYIIDGNNTANDFDIPIENGSKFYLGFFPFYTKKEIVLTDATIFPNYIDYLTKQKHNLISLIVEADADNSYSINLPLTNYKIKNYINKSQDVIFNLLPSLYVEYIDISTNGLTGTPLDTFMNWFIERNVFNTVLIVNGTQVITFDYETLMRTLNWDISFIGTLAGTYSVGTVNYLPKNTTPYWLMCLGQTLNVADFPLLWYHVRSTYAAENINNGDYNLATFKLFVGADSNEYIYYGNSTDYADVTELDFTNNAVSGLYFDEEFFNLFTALESFKIGEYSHYNKIDIISNRYNILDITGNNTVLNYISDPTGDAFNWIELIIGGEGTLVTSPYFTSGTVLQSFHALLKYVTALTLYEIKNITLDDFNELPMLDLVLSSNIEYTNITTLKITRVNSNQTGNNLTDELFAKLNIQSIELLSFVFKGQITIGKDIVDSILRYINLNYVKGDVLEVTNSNSLIEFNVINTVLSTLYLANLANNVTYDIEDTDIDTLETASDVYGQFKFNKVNINTVLKLNKFYNSTNTFDLSRVYFTPAASIEIEFMNVITNYIHTTSAVDTLKLLRTVPFGGTGNGTTAIQFNNKIVKHIDINNFKIGTLNTNVVENEVITLKLTSNIITALDLTNYAIIQSVNLLFEVNLTTVTLPIQNILHTLYILTSSVNFTTLDISQTPNLTNITLACSYLTLAAKNDILINLDTFNNTDGTVLLAYTNYNDLSTAAQTAIANLQTKNWIVTLT
jgi:hypothetical protein